MPVQALSAIPPTLGDRDPSPVRSFQLQARFKTAATSLLRHCQQVNPATLKYQNSQRLACSLPEAVLRKVFRICVQLAIEDRIADDVGDAPTWSWIQVSYVCSEWRKAALGCRDLWRYIDFSQPKTCAITLDRAKASPLHIHSVVSECNVRPIQRTLQIAHRIQSIRLRSSLQNIYPLLELLSHPNPALESLVVDVHIPKLRPFGAEVYSPLSVPSNTTSRGPPLEHLRYLELRSAPFYLLTPRCTHLTELHIHDLPTTERPTVRNFLSTLARLQVLEHLTLDCSFPINIDMAQSSSSTDHRIIELPHRLKTLSLVGSLIETANFLASVVLPPSARLVSRICTSQFGDVKNNIWRLSQWLTSYFSAKTTTTTTWSGDDGCLLPPPLDMLVLTGQEPAGTRFVHDTFDLNPDYRQTLQIKAYRADLTEPIIDLTFEPYEHGSGANATDRSLITSLTSTLNALPLTRIHTLAVRDVDFVTQTSWAQLLREIPLLRVLDISGRAPSGLAWALLLNARLCDSTSFVPRLRDVYLHRVDCSSGGYMISPRAASEEEEGEGVAGPVNVNSYHDLDDSRFLDVLNASLCERRQRGLSPLRSLSLDRCENVMRRSIGDSGRLVFHVVMDARTSKDEDDEAEELGQEGRDVWSARYRGTWNVDHCPKTRHYYRLYALAMDSDF